MYENNPTRELPSELWLGKPVGRNVGEAKVFLNERAAVSWVKDTNPFVEQRSIWRVRVEVQEMYQSAATVERPEL